MIKPENLRRLDLLAAIEERQAAETLARQAAAVRGAVQQDALLSAYQDRLAANWQGGAAVSAAAALRAAKFSAGAQAAAEQIAQGRAVAAAQMARASDAFSQLRARRRHFAEMMAAAARARTADRERREEALRVPVRTKQQKAFFLDSKLD